MILDAAPLRSAIQPFLAPQTGLKFSDLGFISLLSKVLNLPLPEGIKPNLSNVRGRLVSSPLQAAALQYRCIKTRLYLWAR
jgi:hypothetical protein